MGKNAEILIDTSGDLIYTHPMAAKKLTTEKSKRIRKPSSKVSPKTVEPIVVSQPAPARGLSKIQILFQQSWITFKVTFVSYIKVFLVGIGLLFCSGLLGLLIIIPLMISSSGSAAELLTEPTIFQLIGIILVILWAIASFLAISLFFIFLPIASILIIDSATRPSMEELFKKSKPLMLPYFVTSLLMGIIVIGGWTLLVIPGIIFSVLFSFGSFVVVLEKKKGHEALKRSYQLVRSNFWNVFLRIFVIQCCIFIGTFVLENLADQSDLFSLISFIFSLAAGWFAQIYLYLLYKQLRSVTPESTISLKWVWIVAGIGLVLFSIFLYTALTNGLHFLQSPEFLQLMNSDDASVFDSV